MSDDGRRKTTPGGGRSVDCEKIRGQLFDYLSHELGGGPSTLVREHLRRCPACSEEAARIQKVVEALRSHDPGAAAAPAFEGRRRRRLLWLMEHPFIGACVRHHVATSIVVAVVLLAVATLIVMRVVHFALPPKALPSVELILNGGEAPDNPPLIDVPPLREPGNPPTLAPDGLGVPEVSPPPPVPPGKPHSEKDKSRR